MHLFAKTVVLGANPPTATPTRPATNGYSNMVHLLGVNLQSSSNHPATPEMGMRMGPSPCSGKV